MMVKLIIPFTLPGLNDYINEERRHRQYGAKMKREWQDNVILVLKRQIRGKFKRPVYMRYLWVEKDRRRDKDNISSFGRKVIQDALVQVGVLHNDGWDAIAGFSDEFTVDRKNPRVEIIIEEREC